MVLERWPYELPATPRRVLGAPLTGGGIAEHLTKYLPVIQRKDGVFRAICELPSPKELLLTHAHLLTLNYTRDNGIPSEIYCL